jgi:5-methylcytosine-specific restriction protein A
MPIAPPRACTTCGQVGCTAHGKTAWRSPSRPAPARVRGRRLQGLRHQLFREQPFCALCGQHVATIRDHVIPLAEGGPDTRMNTQALCQICSDAKTRDEAIRGTARSAGR